MGNGVSCGVSHCFSGRRRIRNRHVSAAVTSEPLDEGLGHSFCYVSSKITNLDESSQSPNKNNNFYSISGASVSANNSTALSTSLDPYSSYSAAAAAFDCSNSFASVPLRPVDRGGTGGFLSGPIERIHFLSGPLDERLLFSGPIDVDSLEKRHNFLRRSLSSKSNSLFRGLSKVIKNPIKSNTTTTSSSSLSGSISLDASSSADISSLQWAQGRAGEDRVHVVVSEEDQWVFVGIYDGFNGPDATDYLLSNLYPEVQREVHFCRGNLQVLKALSRALKKTEAAYFDVADKMSVENPELALMGSCVLVMLMKGKDLYLMNVGDSRAVLGRKPRGQDEDTDELLNLKALQLTMDHTTCVEEEVVRIRNEHPDDSLAIANDRVKGSLKVTRAFGAGFLKQPKWNDALLEMFRIDYVGTSPYITCNPYLYHHTLGPRDRFLILSSDGLYQYFTNDEAVAEVELFLIATPEGDPAQHLVEEVLFRAAKKAGMDFHELLAIPQGDRRRYHDDVSVIVISLEGRIWKSSVYI